ncbi:MAG: 2OG-Fe(II) oxygenase family protein [Paraburkholderia sp.]|jgi:isopenicillin N synthase-like dioxygenase
MNVRIVDYSHKDAASLFARSLHETGFGVLKNHPIDQRLVEQIYSEWLSFFHSSEKTAYAFDSKSQDGFFSTEVSETAKGNDKRDMKEFFHIYPWGRYPNEVSQAARQYYGLASSLAAELLGWIEEHTPPEVREHFSMPLPEMIVESDSTLLRVLHYPPLTGGEVAGALRAAPHEDINLLTILPAANEPGLQVKDKQGGWHDVPCDFGTLVINIGDMLQEASRGYYPSTTHRVANPVGRGRETSRISLPFFFQPRGDVKLSERYTAGEYLEQRLAELRGG